MFLNSQNLFWWVGSSYQVAKVLELQLQHQSFQLIFRVDFLYDWLFWSPFCSGDSQGSSSAPQFESINSLPLSLFYGPTLTSIHDYLKNYSFNYTDLCWQSDVSIFLLLLKFHLPDLILFHKEFWGFQWITTLHFSFSIWVLHGIFRKPVTIQEKLTFRTLEYSRFGWRWMGSNYGGLKTKYVYFFQVIPILYFHW